MVNGNLECVIRFASAAANPVAEQVWQSIKEETLRAVSVGFMPNSVRVEMRDGQEVYVLSDNELMEISVVPIPANPEALSKMKARALAERSAEQPPAVVSVEETHMSKELEAKIAERDAKVASLESELTTAKAAADKAKADLDAATKRAEQAEKSLADERDVRVTAEVDALVGVKFTPAERDAQLELAKANYALFKRSADARPALALKGEVMGADSAAVTAKSVNANQQVVDEILDELSNEDDDDI
jgi:hypothetical protein